MLALPCAQPEFRSGTARHGVGVLFELMLKLGEDRSRQRRAVFDLNMIEHYW